MPELVIRVECYAGHRGEETPRRLVLGDRTVEVAEVLDRWIAPEHRYFKVRGGDDGVYMLRHDAHPESWEVTMLAPIAPACRHPGPAKGA